MILFAFFFASAEMYLRHKTGLAATVSFDQ